jgi:hypothetical protein
MDKLLLHGRLFSGIFVSYLKYVWRMKGLPHFEGCATIKRISEEGLLAFEPHEGIRVRSFKGGAVGVGWMAVEPSAKMTGDLRTSTV